MKNFGKESESQFIGAAVRMSPMPMGLAIADNRVIVYAVKLTNSNVGIALGRTPEVVGAAMWLFDRLWRQAGRSVIEGPVTLTVLELEVVRRMRHGLTDAQIAGELFISVRTLARVINGLAAKTGASGRFQLAVRLGQLGLLTPPGVIKDAP